MPASIDPYLQDGMVIDFDGVRLSATVPYHVKDLETPVGGTALDRLAEAMSVAGVPAPGDDIDLLGRTLYANRYRIGAWSDADAELLVTWVEDEGAAAGLGTEIEVGTTAEIGETDFDATERAKAWANRTPMYVQWDPSSAGAPGGSSPKYGMRLPYFAGKPFRRYTKTLGYDPGALSEDYATYTNVSTWKGYPPETVLCMSIVGRNAGNGGFRTTFDFAIDRLTLWRGVGRVRDIVTGEFVAVTNAQLAAYNGAKDFQVQGQAEFNNLPI